MPVVLITGCSSGLGKALVKTLHQRGYQVFASARNTQSLRHLATDGISTVQLDVTDLDSIERAVQQVVQQAGSIDLLICNSGIIRIAPVIEQDVGEIQAVLDTNVTGAVRCAQTVAPIMVKQRSGTIAVTGSVSASMTTPYAGLYSASKAAVHCLFRAMRMELAPYGVHVSIIEAGAFKSSLADNNTLDMSRFNSSKSLYVRVADKISMRANMSQGAQSHTAESVSKQIVHKLCSRNPPAQFTVAGSALYYKLIGLLQSFLWPALIERVLRKMFGLTGTW